MLYIFYRILTTDTAVLTHTVHILLQKLYMLSNLTHALLTHTVHILSNTYDRYCWYRMCSMYSTDCVLCTLLTHTVHILSNTYDRYCCTNLSFIYAKHTSILRVCVAHIAPHSMCLLYQYICLIHHYHALCLRVCA